MADEKCFRAASDLLPSPSRRTPSPGSRNHVKRALSLLILVAAGLAGHQKLTSDRYKIPTRMDLIPGISVVVIHESSNFQKQAVSITMIRTIAKQTMQLGTGMQPSDWQLEE